MDTRIRRKVETQTVEVFFYGLFMDEALLEAKGVRPASMEPASAEGFRLRIGQRATIKPEKEEVVYGLVARLTPREVELLYSEPSLEDYRTQTIAVTLNGQRRDVQCFTLPNPPSMTEHNPEYAAKLRALAKRLNLPDRYVASIT
ncbi:MAG: gamma-glutamylcyclotransferase [Gammaproteobacteria bacterium]|nr:gamma-glutamylcyclotransferase [Gammaproteobacteria bacterium]